MMMMMMMIHDDRWLVMIGDDRSYSFSWAGLFSEKPRAIFWWSKEPSIPSKLGVNKSAIGSWKDGINKFLEGISDIKARWMSMWVQRTAVSYHSGFGILPCNKDSAKIHGDLSSWPKWDVSPFHHPRENSVPMYLNIVVYHWFAAKQTKTPELSISTILRSSHLLG